MASNTIGRRAGNEMGDPQAKPLGSDRKGRRTPSRDSGELSERALDLVTGGVGSQLAAQNWSAFLQITGTLG